MGIRSLILLKKIKYFSFGDFDLFLHKNLHETTRVFSQTKELRKKATTAQFQNKLFLIAIFFCLFLSPFMLILNVFQENLLVLNGYQIVEIISYLLWIWLGVYAFKLIAFRLFLNILQAENKKESIDLAELAVFIYAYSSVVFFFKKDAFEIESNLVSENIPKINDILFEVQSNLTIYDDIVIESKINKRNIFADDKKISFNSTDYDGASKLINKYYILLHRSMRLKREIPIKVISKSL